MDVRRQLVLVSVQVNQLPDLAKIPGECPGNPSINGPLYFSIRLKIYFTTEYTQIENQDKYSKFAKSSFCSAATIYLATGRTDLNEILESDSYYLLSHYVFLHFEI